MTMPRAVDNEGRERESAREGGHEGAEGKIEGASIVPRWTSRRRESTYTCKACNGKDALRALVSTRVQPQSMAPQLRLNALHCSNVGLRV